MQYFDVIQSRRSNHHLSNEFLQPKEDLIHHLEQVLDATPSSFNSQSQRMVILLEASHKHFWNRVIDEIAKLVTAEQLTKSKQKIKQFADSLGTVLFFDDEETTKHMMEKFPLYASQCQVWSEQQNGMLQINIWNALVALGYQANLQHYTELVEETIKQDFNIPKHWKMVGQMPFGKAISEPKKKDTIPTKQRIIVLE